MDIPEHVRKLNNEHVAIAPYDPRWPEEFEKERRHLKDVLPAGLIGLRFRDILRKDPAKAAAYAAVKRELAAKFPDDRTAYTVGKTGFIRDAMR